MATGLATSLNMVLGVVIAGIARFQAKRGLWLCTLVMLILGFTWANAAPPEDESCSCSECPYMKRIELRNVLSSMKNPDASQVIELNIVIEITPSMSSVVAAFRDFGFWKAGTPLLIASTPVSAVVPLVNDRATR